MLFYVSLPKLMYRKVANSSRPLIVAAPLVSSFNLLSKSGL